MENVLISGQWKPARQAGSFCAVDPSSCVPLPRQFPISSWANCDSALTAANVAAVEMANLPPRVVAGFLEEYARQLDDNALVICEAAYLEAALPLKSRLLEVEVPRTARQLRLAAAAARDGSWRMATIDSANDLRSCYGPIGSMISPAKSAGTSRSVLEREL